MRTEGPSGTDRPTHTERPSRIERPSIQVADLAQLYARGELPCAPDHVGELAEAEFGPVGDVSSPPVESIDPIEAFCVAWACSPAPDTPTLPGR
jgi:hypothetical protein